jgi:protein-serine/threonine kinase
MRDKLGWAASSPRIASAQARLAGDEELLNMMELLQKANMMSSEALSAAGLGIDHGPLTGPAHLVNDNVFDKSFVRPGDEMVESSGEETSSDTVGDQSETQSEAVFSPSNENLEPNLYSISRTTSEEDRLSPGSRPGQKRSALKRTYTDTSGLSLQHRLTEALAQPYQSSNRAPAVAPLSRAQNAQPAGPTRANTMHERAPHGHRNNHPQAIFTTDCKAPWTITAANDLACLIFGVTGAEVRKLGIMEVIKEERRKWLEEKLRNPDAGTAPRQPKQPVSSPKAESSNGRIAGMGNGVTAKLLSKPPARETYQSRRSKTENGVRSTPPKSANHASNKSRGVLLCGDVVPIKKLNGTYGSASLWVKEKSGGLIWVMEEIAEDVAYLTVDEIGSVVKGSGAIEPIWGMDRVRKGMDVQKLIPSFPKLAGTYTGALDYDEVARLRRFTVRTSNSISIPVTIDQLSGESTFRVSSFPHIAGILVLNPRTMRVSSSNSVFSAALFGHDDPDGMLVTELIPGFDKVLHIMTDEDKIKLVDGIVIPEHSFRRARSLLAMREGSADAAQYFLRPSGLPAKHRDGADIMIDVQMRVVNSGRDPIYNETVIEEDVAVNDSTPESEIVFALWITYSRQLHAVHHGIGSVTIAESRPSTPPSQPRPGPGIDESIPTPLAIEESKTDIEDPRISLLTRQMDEANASSDDASPTVGSENEVYEHPSPELIEADCKVVKKKKIEDFNILEEMGQGAYGQVKLARYKKSGAKKMVIKYVTKRRILVDTWHRDRRLGTVPLEIHVLDYLRRDGLQHPNIVEMADFFEDDINYYIEMIPHGLPGMDLFDYIELRVTMDEAECRKIFKQVAEALRHLHLTAKVVHRDIKDENVILDGEGKVKLVDFGSAAYIKSGPFDVFVGTIDYAAPEVLQGRPYRGKEQDVWALGILLYTIVYKENPFYSIDEIMDHDLRVPWVPSEECIDLIRKMLDRDVERRIGIQAVIEHPWCLIVDESDDEDGAGGDVVAALLDEKAQARSTGA